MTEITLQAFRKNCELTGGAVAVLGTDPVYVVMSYPCDPCEPGRFFCLRYFLLGASAWDVSVDYRSVGAVTAMQWLAAGASEGGAPFDLAPEKAPKQRREFDRIIRSLAKVLEPWKDAPSAGTDPDLTPALASALEDLTHILFCNHGRTQEKKATLKVAYAWIQAKEDARDPEREVDLQPKRSR